MLKVNANDVNRAMSAIFTGPVFKSVFQSGSSDYCLSNIRKYRLAAGIRKGASVRKAISVAYQHLNTHYRNEYFYKNTIANKLLIERHDLNHTTLLNEFRIGGSIADLVMINGVNTVYEIKTELDSPEKLSKQIQDYRRVSPKIYLVTHYTLTRKYLELVGNCNIGVIGLSGDGECEIVQDANYDASFLNNTAMMQTLRKEEYSAILQSFYGALPNVSNIQFFRECERLSQDISTEVYHQFMMQELKKRKIKVIEKLNSLQTPFELRHICLSCNPSAEEYDQLNKFLKQAV